MQMKSEPIRISERQTHALETFLGKALEPAHMGMTMRQNIS
jgi:hypothetical protein